MNPRLLVLASLLALTACGSFAATTPGESSGGEASPVESPPPAPYYGDQATLIEAKPGDAFTVVLPQDPTGAESWVLDPAHDHTVARLEAEGELAAMPEGCDGCSPGAQRYYHFVAVGMGRLDARFRRKPQGDVTAPMSREVVLQMRVETQPHWAE